MTTSGSASYTITEAEIIQEAFEMCAGDPAEPIEPAIYASIRRTLNLMIKADQRDGLYLWTYKEATLFLQKSTASYQLGPTGTHATESYVETTLSVDAAAGADTLNLTSITGISVGDYIGITLDDGTLFWTTVTDGTFDELPSAASAGNKVYTYTTKILRPLNVSEVRRRDSSDIDTPIELKSGEAYFTLPNKQTDGVVVQAFFDPQLTNATLYTWPRSNTVADKIVFRYKKPIEDFSDGENTPEYPVEMFEEITLKLAYKISAKLSVPIPERLDLLRRIEGLGGMDETSVYIIPGTR
jgi:hypothetical protein